MADFNTELQTIVADVEGVFATIKADLIAVLGVAEAELPKLYNLLAIGAGLTALIPGVGAYIVAAEGAITFVEDLVKTIDGILMPASEAARIGVQASPATDAEKRQGAVDFLVQSYPDVPTNTHDLHVALAYAKAAKLAPAKP